MARDFQTWGRRVLERFRKEIDWSAPNYADYSGEGADGDPLSKSIGIIGTRIDYNSE